MFKRILQACLNASTFSVNLFQRCWREIALSAIFVITGSVWFHWNVIGSGFDLVYGDYGDNRLSMMLMEHWFNTFSGKVSFLNPIFFYPAKGVLGFTDSYFIFSLPYSIGRLAGFTEYGAFQSVIILFNVLAFYAMYWFLRRVLSLDVLICNVFATIFSFSNVIAVNMGHMQFLSIALLPLISGMLFRFVTRLREHPNSSFIYGFVFITVFPLLAFTSFYTAWFYALYLFVTLAILTLAKCWLREWVFFSDAWCVVKTSRFVLISLFLFGLLSSIPFLITYVPLYLERGGFVPDELFISTIPHPIDLINVGAANAVWGHLLGQWIPNMTNRLSAYELNMGFPIVFGFLLLVGSVVNGIFWVRGGTLRAYGVSYAGLVALFGVGVLVCLGLIVNWHDGFSLWWYVRGLVPGAASIRVVSRFQLVLLFPACVTVAIFLSLLKQSYEKIHYRPQFRVRAVILYASLLVFLLAEQSSPVYARVSKSEELSRLGRIMPPPSSCKVFALTRIRPTDGKDGNYLNDAEQAIVRRAQVDAIYIAYKYKVPTVNGLSSLTPIEYWMFNTMHSAYTEEVGEWLARHNLNTGVCTFNIESNSWSEIEPNLENLPIGENLLKPATQRTISETMSYGMQGFSGAGFVGDTWTSDNSKIHFVVPARVKSIRLSFYVVNPAGSTVKIAINGHLAHDEHYQGGMHTVTLSVLSLLRSVEINSNIFVPKDVNKVSLDTRRLGVLLTDVRLSREL